MKQFLTGETAVYESIDPAQNHWFLEALEKTAPFIRHPNGGSILNFRPSSDARYAFHIGNNCLFHDTPNYLQSEYNATLVTIEQLQDWGEIDLSDAINLL